MVKSKFISIYEKNHVNKGDERVGLFERLNENYTIKKVLYPGAYAHITPSFIFPDVIFNDVYKILEPFYDSDEVYNYIKKRKSYSEEPVYSYVKADFNSPLPFDEEEFDLLISQYSGFISHACKRYLKIGGILMANSSHGDASLASISPGYEFIAAIHKRSNKFTHSTRALEKYFIPKKDIKITVEFMEKHKRGVGYTKTATDYVFKRVS